MFCYLKTFLPLPTLINYKVSFVSWFEQQRRWTFFQNYFQNNKLGKRDIPPRFVETQKLIIFLLSKRNNKNHFVSRLEYSCSDEAEKNKTKTNLSIVAELAVWAYHREHI